MAIYVGSRYASTALTERDGVEIFDIRERFNFNLTNAYVYEFVEGDTLDSIAYRFWGDSQFSWCILEANKQFMLELDIRNGDKLMIPSLQEVLEVHE